MALNSLVHAAGFAFRPGHAFAEEVRRRLHETFQPRSVLLTDSGTSALVLAMRATVPKGAVVALPGYACMDVVAAAKRADVRIALYDLDPRTLSPDTDSVRNALALGARAIVVAPLFGYPVEMDAVRNAAAAAGAWLIEDAAQAAGSTLAARRVGTFGDLSILSFGRGKGTTSGSGGALLIHHESLASSGEAEGLREASHGLAAVVSLGAQWLLARPSLYSIPASIPALKLGEMVYREAREPAAMSAVALVILVDALRNAERERKARVANASALALAAEQARVVEPVRPVAGAAPGFLRFAIVDRTASPSSELGIARGYPIRLDEHPETQRLLAPGARGRLPGSDVLKRSLLTLPTHSRVDPRTFRRLIQWLHDRGHG